MHRLAPWREWLLVIASRGLNTIILGSPSELFCTRIYRARWKRAVLVIDAIWFRLTGKPHHCRRAYLWDVLTNGRRK